MDSLDKFGYKLGGLVSYRRALDYLIDNRAQLSLAILIRKYSPGLEKPLAKKVLKCCGPIIYTNPIPVSRISDLLCIDDVLAVTLREEEEYLASPIPIELVNEKYDADELLMG